jgi:hypothetical protein
VVRPGVSTLLLRFMPVGVAVPTFERTWIAAVLTAQWLIGLVLMLSAFALLGWLVSIVVPEVGTLFLNYARAIAALDLPRQVWSADRALTADGTDRHQRYGPGWGTRQPRRPPPDGLQDRLRTPLESASRGLVANQQWRGGSASAVLLWRWRGCSHRSPWMALRLPPCGGNGALAFACCPIILSKRCCQAGVFIRRGR